MAKNKIYYDYIESNPSLLPFFTSLPKDFLTKLRNKDFLSKYLHKKTSTTPQFNIVSGQQPGIFGGPLYTFYKIIALSKLTKMLTNEFKINVKPYFWVHSWDHDWEEACSINFLTYDYQILSVICPPFEEEKGKLLCKISLDKKTILSQIEKIFLNIKNSDFTPILKEKIINILNTSSNLSEWSSLLLKYFFSHSAEMSIFEPHQQPNFDILTEIISIAITNHQELYEKLSKTTLELEKLNYKPQVHKSPQDAFFFIEENGKRTKVLYQNSNFISVQSGKIWTKHDLLNILRYEPERFTPNLITRCIYQQMLLNPIIYIAGPAEVAYWAQLKDLFDTFSLPMPIIYPRPRIILLPTKVKKWLVEFGINNLSNLFQDENNFDLTLSNLLTTSSSQIIQVTEKVREEVKERFLPRLYSILKGNFSSIQEFEKNYSDSANKIVHEIEKLITKLSRASAQKNEEIQQKGIKIRNVLFPNKTYQERFFSPIPFLSEYGLEVLKIIEETIDIKNPNFQEVVL